MKDKNDHKKCYFITAWVIISLGFVYGGLCLWPPCWLPAVCPNDDNTETIRIALLIIGAGLVLLNLHFVTERIRKTDEQIRKADDQLFFQSLHQGVNMLYADDFVKQMGGIDFLHQLALSNKEDKERKQAVQDAFCTAVKYMPHNDPLPRNEDGKIQAKKRYQEIKQLKEKILYTVNDPGSLPEKPFKNHIRNRNSLYLSKSGEILHIQKRLQRYLKDKIPVSEKISMTVSRQIFAIHDEVNSSKIKKGFSFVTTRSDIPLTDDNIYNDISEGINLDRADLSGLNLSMIWLNDASLYKANLSRIKVEKYARLSRVNLTDTNFRNMDVEDLHLSQCNLIGAYFQEVNLSKVTFFQSNLLGTKFQRAQLGGASFEGSDLEDARFDEAEISSEKARTDFSGAILSKISNDEPTKAFFTKYIGSIVLNYAIVPEWFKDILDKEQDNKNAIIELPEKKYILWNNEKYPDPLDKQGLEKALEKIHFQIFYNIENITPFKKVLKRIHLQVLYRITKDEQRLKKALKVFLRKDEEKEARLTSNVIRYLEGRLWVYNTQKIDSLFSKWLKSMYRPVD